jgi:radical SAM protein with 4Fe4S-binding SPASM domain
LVLNEELSRRIIEEELLDYIIFSLDAATKKTYAMVKGVDAYDEVEENIIRFLQLKKEKVARMEKYAKCLWWDWVKPIVGVQILKMKETDSEIEEFMNKWDCMDKVKKVINYRNRLQEVGKMENEGEKKQASQKLERELWEAFYAGAELPVEHAIIGHFNRYCDQIEDRSVVDVTPLKRFSCAQLNEGISILWNGDVTLCRQDFDGKMVIGNLNNESLDNILKSLKREEIIEAQKSGDFSKGLLCDKCKEWYYPRA